MILARLLVFLTLLVVVGSPVSAKTLRMAYDSDPTSLDPHEQLASATLQTSHLLFDPLVRWRSDFSFEPRLAEKWEKIDERTTRFRLRAGVKHHSGNPLTAKDVVWTFERLRTSPDFKGLFEPFAEARAVDDLTVDLVTRAPYPLVLNLATYIFPMDSAFYSGKDSRDRPKDEIVKHGASFASMNASGTGPFIVTRREQGVRLLFKRNENYWDKASPGNVTEIQFTPIKESATRVAALLAGDVDFIAPAPPADFERINSDGCCDLVTMTGTRILVFQLNQKRVEAFGDPRVREAMALAVNNKAIVDKILRGAGTPAGQLSPPGYDGHDPTLAPRYDPARALELMKEAGYAEGFRVTMMAPNNRYVSDFRIAEAVVSMLARIKIKVDLTTMPKAQYWPKFDERAADIMMIGWHSDTEDSANFYEFLAMTPNVATGYGQYNSGNYSSAEVDRLTLQTQSMTDENARSAVMKQIEKILRVETAMLPIHWPNLSWAARKGVRIAPVLNVMDFPYLGDLVME